MADKNKGKVKWYSIRKGFGFITPSEDNSTIKEDVFFHQSSIKSDAKNKWLETNYEVEFDVYTDDDGKYRCKTVTAPGGGDCEVPKRKSAPRKKVAGKGKKDGTDDEGETTDDGDVGKNGETKGKGRNRSKGNKKVNGSNDKKDGENSDGNKKPKGGRKPRKRFDDEISADVKAKMKEKKLDMRQTSILLSLDKNRLKFGPDGYAALAHADGIMAEGSFSTDDDGKVTLTWKNMLKFEGGEWKTDDPIANTSSGVLIGSFNWTDDNISGLKKIETPDSLWGEDKTDPADALQSNNFQMRKCFLTKTPAKPRGRRRPRPRGGKKGEGKENGKHENGKENGKEEKVSS